MADLLFYNGTLLTQDADRPVAEALAAAGGRIAAVGLRAEVEGLIRPGTRRVDLPDSVPPVDFLDGALSGHTLVECHTAL